MADFVQLPSGIVIREADFAEMNKPVAGEIAGTGNGRDITRGYVDALPIVPPTDSVLVARCAGDYQQYEDLLRDDQVGTCLQQRKLALAAKEWKVEPGASDRASKKAADRLSALLNRLEWDDHTKKMLSGLFFGYAVAEVLWSQDGLEVTIDRIKVKRQRRFAFSPSGELKLLTSATPQGELMPDKKFWTFSCGADHDDDPYGLGLAHWLYWPVFFKRCGLRLWTTFMEKFAAPTALGKYPTGADKTQQNRLLQSLAAIRTDGGVIIPEGMQIELIEAARSGTADYVSFYEHMDRAISKVILGHSGAADSTPGKLGGEDNAIEVRRDIIKADADIICGSFNASVARWLADYNDPRATPPRVWRVCEEPEDLTKRAQRDKTIVDMGFRPTARYITETYGGDWEEKAPLEPPKPPVPNANPPAPAFAEPTQCPHCADFADAAGPDALDGLRDLALEGWQPLMWPVTNPLVAALDAALQRGDSLADFAEVLPGLLEKMDITDLTTSLANAGLMARAAGDAIPDGEL